MKISSVEIFDLEVPSVGPDWHPVVVRVNTDEGVSGIGEIGLAYGAGHSAGAGMIKNIAELCLIGLDPFQTEKIWDVMQKKSFWGLGGGPVVFGAMSAIDIALWDIKGKTLNLPVYQLMGGPCREELRAYASQIQFGWGQGKGKNLCRLEEYAEDTLRIMEEGFDCIKINPIRYDENGNFIPEMAGILSKKTLKMIVDRVKVMREVGGESLDIIVEMNSRASISAAIQIATRLEEYDCMYLEEPVHFLDLALIKKVSEKTKVPLAGGERLYTRWGFHQFIEAQVLDVIQPDIGLAGGFTEVKKICDMAHMFDLSTQIHVCGGPVASAAALHIEAAIPNFLIHEHHVRGIKPGTREICYEDYQPANGRFKLPDKPGLGIALNEEIIYKSPHYTVS